MKIPIDNLYYILLYAWDRLDEGAIVKVSGEDPAADVANLFARVLSSAVARIIKRGLDRGYRRQEEAMRGVRGRIELADTVKRNLGSQGRVLCTFDDLDFDIPHNQIIRSTIRLLLRDDTLDDKIRVRLRDIYRRMHGVSIVALTSDLFRRAHLHRNGRFYDFLLKVCWIAWEQLLPDPRTGRLKFRDFTRDEKLMGTVFEQFIYNFFLFEQGGLSVERPHIAWMLEAMSPIAADILPQMKTDVVLRDPYGALLIEAKYTIRTYQEFFGTQKLRSTHLYQLMTYVANWPSQEQLSAVLLYASTGEDFAYTYRIGDRSIIVRSLDLDRPWQAIRADLLSLTDLVPHGSGTNG